MTQQAKAGRDTLTKASIVFSMLAGAALRTYHLFVVGLAAPFHLGGLYYQMSLEILRNGFRLPAAIPFYYPGGLPFAYPPLAFYLQAGVMRLLEAESFVTVNCLPPLFSIGSLVAFYFLARMVIRSKAGAAGAMFIFAIHPLAFLEQIEAMGLAEALGTLTLILYLLALARAAEDARPARWVSAGLCLGLCIVSSPGSIYASILISLAALALSVWQAFARRQAGWLAGCCIIGASGLATSAPYWGTVIMQHGSGIFLNAFGAQNSGLLQQLADRALALALIKASPFWNGLFLFGLLAAEVKKQYSLIFFSVVLLLMPRETWVMCIPASLLGGFGALWLLELLGGIPKINTNYLKAGVIWTLALFFMADAAYNLAFLIKADAYDLPAARVDELRKIKELNLIPARGNVLVLGNWGLVEWAPALLERTVINNPFGLEWLPEASIRIGRLNGNLLEGGDTAAALAQIRKNFSGLEEVYVLAERGRLETFSDLPGGKTGLYETLREFDELGVGRIVFQD